MSHTGGRPRTPAVIRFFQFVRYEPLTECWEWTGTTVEGYGTFAGDRGHERNEPEMAHRFAYELLVGPIPEGLTLDHLCRVRHCCNPEHLEPVTSAENTARSPLTQASINRAKTHCHRGHPFSDANLGRNANGTRICRECRRESSRAYRARNAERLRVEARERWRRENWPGYGEAAA